MIVFSFVVGCAIVVLALWLHKYNQLPGNGAAGLGIVGLAFMFGALVTWYISGEAGNERSSTGIAECEAVGGTWIGGSCLPSYGSD